MGSESQRTVVDVDDHLDDERRRYTPSIRSTTRRKTVGPGGEFEFNGRRGILGSPSPERGTAS